MTNWNAHCRTNNTANKRFPMTIYVNFKLCIELTKIRLRRRMCRQWRIVAHEICIEKNENVGYFGLDGSGDKAASHFGE